MNSRVLLPALALCFFVCSSAARAHVHYPPTVENLVRSADLIAVVKVTSVSFDPPPAKVDGTDPILAYSGRYDLSVLCQVKGALPNVITVNVGPLYAFPYLFNLTPPHPGDTLIVFLDHGPDGYVDANEAMPFYPVIMPPKFVVSVGGPLESVYAVCSYSLADAALRPLMASLLKSAKDTDVMLAMAKYLDDSNGDVKNDVLACMAKNSQLAAIPMIARYADRTLVNGEISASVMALASYTSPDAVPYLNPLVWDPLLCVRQYALLALKNTADNTSAPYLVLALRDPEPDLSVFGSARFILAKNILKLKNPYELRASLKANYQSDVLAVNDWWSDELSGKHLVSDDPGAVQEQAREASESIPSSVIDINPLLFKPFPSLRERAIAVLVGKADKSSIPYLVLALQDPDGKVSYNAYLTLRRLLGVPSAPLSKDDYLAGQDAATKPLYAWWSDELSGKHSKVLPFAPISPDLLRSLPAPKN